MRKLCTPLLFTLMATAGLAQPGTWNAIADLPAEARSFASGFAVGDYGYIACGSGTAGLLNDLWRYDAVADTWEQRASLPAAARSACLSFTVGGKGYLCFGLTDGGSVAEVWSYDPEADSWEQKGDFPGGERDNAMGFTLDGVAYVGLGFQGGAGDGPNDFWAYDPGTDTWTQKADYPGEGRGGLLAFGLGNTGYAGCGGQGLSYYDDFYAYDPVGDAWTARQNYGGGTDAFAVGLGANGRGYVACGNSFAEAFWSYGPADAWTQLADFPNPGGPAGAPRFAAGFNLGNRFYVGGGTNGNGERQTAYKVYQPLCDPPTGLVVSNDGPVCGQGEVGLTASAQGTEPLSYVWSGLLIQGDNTLQNISALQVSAGDQPYTVTVTNACGSVEGSTTVTMTEPPMGVFNYNYEGGGSWCTGFGDLSVQNVFNWVPGGVFSSSDGAVVDAESGLVDVSATGPGDFTVQYDLPAIGGCEAYQTSAGVFLYDPSVWYPDQDGDGYGDPGLGQLNCQQPLGSVSNGDDLCPFDHDKVEPGACGCGNPEPGTACDDGDPDTQNDVITEACVCQGGGACVAPSIVEITNGGPICGQGEVVLSVTATGTGPLTYEWTGLLIQGDNTLPTVTALQVVPGDQSYTVVVSNACGTEGNETIVTMTEPPFGQFNYTYPGMDTWCTSGGPVNIQNVYNWVPGGVFSSPNGAVVDPASGVVNAAATGPGSFTVLYDLPAQGGCDAYQTGAPITLYDAQVWYADQDGDGAGDPATGSVSCLQPFSTVGNNDDQCPFDYYKVEPGTCGCGNPEPGTPCDDANANTINDVVGPDCVCAGEGPQTVATVAAPMDRVRYDRANGTIYVREDERTPVLLIDATGRIVMQANGPMARFQVAPLPTGLYFVRASGLSGRVVVE